VNRTRALLVSLAVGLAAASGVFALGTTLSLSRQSRTADDQLVARRTAQLDRYETSLRKALEQKPPALPALPATTSATTMQSAAPARVVYHRPPPVVVTQHAGEHEDEHEDHEDHDEYEGNEADD
jgi:hypothetical protein